MRCFAAPHPKSHLNGAGTRSTASRYTPPALERKFRVTAVSSYSQWQLAVPPRECQPLF